MKKRYRKATALFLSLLISEMTSITVNAHKWYGNGYYMVRDENDLESDKEIEEINFNYQLIINQVTYKDLCCFYLDTGGFTRKDAWFPIAIYTSADRAINQEEAIEYEKFYLSIANSKIKDAYQLVDGKPRMIEDIDALDTVDKDNLAFSLVQDDLYGNEQIVAYINGKDMIAMAMSSVKDYEQEKRLIKK